MSIWITLANQKKKYNQSRISRAARKMCIWMGLLLLLFTEIDLFATEQWKSRWHKYENRQISNSGSHRNAPNRCRASRIILNYEGMPNRLPFLSNHSLARHNKGDLVFELPSTFLRWLRLLLYYFSNNSVKIAPFSVFSLAALLGWQIDNNLNGNKSFSNCIVTLAGSSRKWYEMASR